MLRYFGSTDVDRIIDTMDYAVYTYDIGHIIVDNL
jgi:twinkle protein